MSDTFSFEEAQEQKPASSKQQKPSKTFSWDEAQGTSKGTKNETRPLPQTAAKKPEEKTSLGGRIAGSAANIGDMILGTPGMSMGTEMQVGLTGYLAAKGHSHKESSVIAKAVADKFQKDFPLTGALNKLMKWAGYGDDYDESAVNQVMGKASSLIEKGGEALEKHTGGVINKEDTQALANIAMLSAGPAAAKLGGIFKAARSSIPKAELEAGKVSHETAEQLLKKYEEQGHNEETGQRKLTVDKMRELTDADINAEKQAYKLMQEGASRKEVLRARAQNPLVGKKLDEMMERRQQAIQGAQAPKVEGRNPIALPENMPAQPAPKPQAPPQIGFDPQSLANQKRMESLKADRAKRAQEVMQRAAELKNRAATPAGTPLQRLPDGRLRPTDQPPGQSLPKPPALETALAKVKSGKSFDLTAEERIALKGTKQGPSQIMRPQQGAVNPKALAAIAAVGGGAAAGYALADQDKLEGAIAGGLGGAALMALPKFATAVKDNWSKALKPVAVTAGVSGGLAYADKDHPIEGALIGLAWGARGFLPKAKIPKIGDMTIDELTNLRNGNIAAENRNISNVANGIRTIVKDPARREAVSMAVESGSMKGLSPDEVRAANIYKGFTKAYGEAAKNAGVLNDFIENYVTHIVEKEGLPQSKVAEFMASLGIGEESKGAGTSASSQFAKHRKYATFDDLQKALEGSGLKIKTRDVADIAEIYGRSMNRAIENKSYVEALKAGKTEGPDSKPFVMPVDKAPKDYVYVNSPQLRGQAVHPDMAPALKFTMEAKNPNEVVKGLLALSMAQKRLNTSLSFFHAANLANAFVAASGLKSLGGKGAIDAALKAYKTGGLGDTTDLLLRSGLKVEEGRPIELDQKALTKMGQLSDLLINKTLGTNIKAGEKALGTVDKLQSQVFDKVTWDYMHTGMKLAVATREFERLSIKHPELPKEKVAQQVASFVNDTFGGLDWYRVATEAESKLGRRMAMAALSPSGRVGMQIAMFAPDWTFSTFRALYKALPDTGGNKQPLTRELHRAYALRTAVLYMTLLNGINMQTSGHSIFDNKDPTKLEYKDGTTQQVAKHAMEGYEWLIKPRQTAINKLGPVVKEPMEQLEGKQYLSADGKSPAIGSRIGHALSSVLPIPAQQGGVPGRTPLQSATRAAQGMIGMPVYGMTKTEKAKSKEQRARDKRLKELRGEK